MSMLNENPKRQGFTHSHMNDVSIHRNSHHLYSDPRLINKHPQAACSCFHQGSKKYSFPTQEWIRTKLEWNVWCLNTTSLVLVSAGISRAILSILTVIHFVMT